ncbi:MAG: SH3 domain-containing protein [Proteobacteria bacterium]|nr:SH3 domain-containing protein [Pseudomonadota bacterium]
MRSYRIARFTIFFLLTVLAPLSTFPQSRYVKITANRVNVRDGPDTSSPIVAKARVGDVFELQGRDGKWYKIRMFSVNLRYVHKSLAEVTHYSVTPPKGVSTRRKIFKAFVRAEDRAEQEADRTYPVENKYGRPISGNVKRNIDYMWFLSDRYKLGVMHRFNVQSPIHSIILEEGIRKNW